METVGQEFADTTIEEISVTDGRSILIRYHYRYNASDGDRVKFSLFDFEFNAQLDTVLQAFSGMEETPLNSSVDRYVYRTLHGNVSTRTEFWAGSSVTKPWNRNSGPEVLRAMWADPDTTDNVSSLVQQINFALRSYNSFVEFQAARKEGTKLPEKHMSSGQQVPGRVYIDKLHAQVRWEWLALPIVLVILTAVLLVVTVWLSNTTNVGIWKESLLALLLFGRYESETRSTSSSARDEGQIRLVACDLTSQLTQSLDTSDEKLKSNVMIRRRSPTAKA